MINSLWSRWVYEDKDLSDIPNATEDYRCPNCGRLFNMESVYDVDGIEYPQYYNEYLSSDMDGTIHDWTEVHCCTECKTIFQFRNGCF